MEDLSKALQEIDVRLWELQHLIYALIIILDDDPVLAIERALDVLRRRREETGEGGMPSDMALDKTIKRFEGIITDQ